MSVIKFNLAVPQKYIKDGAEKTYWANVGTLTQFSKQDGSVSRIVEIPAIGLKANVFPMTPKQPQLRKEDIPVIQEGFEGSKGIDVNNIPF